MDSPDFVWRTKHLLRDELNVLKWKLNVNIKNTIDNYQLKTSMLRLNAGLLTSGRKCGVFGQCLSGQILLITSLNSFQDAFLRYQQRPKFKTFPLG
jgi:hypothetical protein